jgi:hypothetical protein
MQSRVLLQAIYNYRDPTYSVEPKIGKKNYLFPLAVGFAALTGFGGEGFVVALTFSPFTLDFTLVGVAFLGSPILAGVAGTGPAAGLAGITFAGTVLTGSALTGAGFVFLTSTKCPPIP